jgi:hypothetical protein
MSEKLYISGVLLQAFAMLMIAYLPYKYLNPSQLNTTKTQLYDMLQSDVNIRIYINGCFWPA